MAIHSQYKMQWSKNEFLKLDMCDYQFRLSGIYINVYKTKRSN